MMAHFTRRYRIGFGWLLLAIWTCSAGCGGSATQPGGTAGGEGQAQAEPKPTRGVIAYSAMTLKNPFFKIIADSLTAEAEKQGFRVIVNDANLDVKTQSQHIDDYIAAKVAAIVINPVDRQAIGVAVQRANAAQIPVFTCDLECEAEGAQIAGHVGTDNFQGGELAGQAMIEALGEAGGKVLILHLAQANSCVLRVAGFRKVIEAHNQDATHPVEIVAELDGGGLQDKAYRATSDALQSHPDLDGIFAINDPSALGAWTALHQANATDRIVIVGFDGQLEGKQAILEGKIYADPIQFPDLMGIKTVEKITRYLDGEEFEASELIPTRLYRQTDAALDPALKPAS